jgi:hypothetical protein
MLTSALIFLSGLVAILVLLDQLLTDSEKARLDKRLIILWNFLDDFKGRSIKQLLAIGPIRAFLAAGTVVAYLILSDYLPSKEPPREPPASLLTKVLVTCSFCVFMASFAWFLPPFIDRCKKRAPIGTNIIMYLFILLMFAVLMTLHSEFMESGVIVGILILIAALAIGVTALGLLITILFVLTTALVWALEFLIRRIAQHPKPILAASLIVGCIAAILKLLPW